MTFNGAIAFIVICAIASAVVVHFLARDLDKKRRNTTSGITLDGKPKDM